jgi:broad specificity phosphatase PhoE
VGTIHLIRHGRSALEHDGRWYRAREVSSYEDAYDAAGIRDDLAPTAAVVALARRADVLLASDMRRAIESARRLDPTREPTIIPALRELRLEPPVWIPASLPISVWDAMSHLQWTTRIVLRSDHDIVRRARQASDALLEAAYECDNVVAVTHGGIRRIIAADLLRRGRALVSRDGGHRNWSCWTLRSR